jgi:hypothetical protein
VNVIRIRPEDLSHFVDERWRRWRSRPQLWVLGERSLNPICAAVAETGSLRCVKAAALRLRIWKSLVVDEYAAIPSAAAAN